MAARLYGLPPKLVTIIKKFYDSYECSVIVNNSTSDWFQVESGVRQGCIISPILFFLTIDWVMNETTDRPRGIQWDLFSHLEDFDFADDLAILSTTFNNIQEKSNRLSKISGQTGLNISTTKTKAMTININST